MISVDLIVRSAAVVAAVAVVAGPWLVAKAQAATSAVARPSTAVIDDAHTVLEIARRLQDAGLKRGVELCQQLIDVMLQVQEKAP